MTGRCLLQTGQITCTGGERRGPVEDSGGIGGYTQLCEVFANPRHPQYEDLADWYAGAASTIGTLDAAPFDAEAFDIDSVNAKLARFALLRSAGPPTETELAAVVRPVRWLLQRAGTDGLELTAAGYLKPAVVRAAVAELGWQERCYGSINREDQAIPVMALREDCVRWKLLRKTKGRLVLTPAARKMADDDAALWTHVTERFALTAGNAADLVHRVVVGWLLADTMPDWKRHRRGTGRYPEQLDVLDARRRARGGTGRNGPVSGSALVAGLPGSAGTGGEIRQTGPAHAGRDQIPAGRAAAEEPGISTAGNQHDHREKSNYVPQISIRSDPVPAASAAGCGAGT